MMRFHWRLPQGGERSGASRAHQASLAATGLPDLDAQIQFARAAEASGIDSLLIDFGWSKPDPAMLAAVLGLATTRIRFIIAHRSGLMSPPAFVQQLNTLSTLIAGRFSVNIVAGHSPDEQRGYGDTLTHDQRYDRTEEFLAVCRAFWRNSSDVNFSGRYYTIEHGRLNTPFVAPDRTFPELYIAGNSPSAQRLAISQGTCWMRLADTTARTAPELPPVLQSGTEVGLRCSIIARPTREDAIDAARALKAAAGADYDDKSREAEFVKRTDSVLIKSMFALADTEWLTPSLWTGAVRSHGAMAIALVGSASDVASAVLEYRRIGVSQFILSGWPKLEEMRFFGSDVLPLIRAGERAQAVAMSA